MPNLTQRHTIIAWEQGGGRMEVHLSYVIATEKLLEFKICVCFNQWSITLM